MFVLLAVISISAQFEGGSVGKIEHVTNTHIRCSLVGQSDQNGRNRQASWYFFQIKGARHQTLVIDLVDLPGEYNYKSNQGAVTKDIVPVFSEDNQKWQFVTRVEYNAEEPRLRLFLTPNTDHLWIAHTPPYTNTRLAQLMRTLGKTSSFQSEVIGLSVHKRPLFLWTITDTSVQEPEKKVIWLMARQHSWETFTSWVTEGAVRFLVSDTNVARTLRRQAIWKILPTADPDGLALGGVRFNANGYDLNRNWDTANPVMMPEIVAQRAAILRWVDSGRRVDLFLSMHNTETSEYLEGPPDEDGLYADFGLRFFKLLKAQTSFTPSRPFSSANRTTNADSPGRMTVVQGLWRDHRLPAYITEQRVSRNPGSGQLLTIENRKNYGKQLVHVLFDAASTPKW